MFFGRKFRRSARPCSPASRTPVGHRPRFLLSEGFKPGRYMPILASYALLLMRLFIALLESLAGLAVLGALAGFSANILGPTVTAQFGAIVDALESVQRAIGG